MAKITIRLKSGTYILLRRAAAAQLCDQNRIIEPAVTAFAQRKEELRRQIEDKFPALSNDRDSLLQPGPHRRHRRSFTKNENPIKVCTTVSDETNQTIRTLATNKHAISDVVDRALRFYLWDEEQTKRTQFADFLYPAIHFPKWREFLRL